MENGVTLIRLPSAPEEIQETELLHRLAGKIASNYIQRVTVIRESLKILHKNNIFIVNATDENYTKNGIPMFKLEIQMFVTGVCYGRICITQDDYIDIAMILSEKITHDCKDVYFLEENDFRLIYTNMLLSILEALSIEPFFSCYSITGVGIE